MWLIYVPVAVVLVAAIGSTVLRAREGRLEVTFGIVAVNVGLALIFIRLTGLPTLQPGILITVVGVVVRGLERSRNLRNPAAHQATENGSQPDRTATEV